MPRSMSCSCICASSRCSVLGRSQENDAAEIRKILEDGRAEVDSERSCIWAGGGVGLIHRVEFARVVIRDMVKVMEEAKERVDSMFASS